MVGDIPFPAETTRWGDGTGRHTDFTPIFRRKRNKGTKKEGREGRGERKQELESREGKGTEKIKKSTEKQGGVRELGGGVPRRDLGGLRARNPSRRGGDAHFAARIPSFSFLGRRVS